ncbi:hypothetical protein [uncultured Ruminococcus sp.]|uniref:hypothetical protein n=1 Tax=uncultured Ruminococcus sp. TaxID=165186 RepID=UPI0025E06087|nr:hypothetical protein [uncultured Ruminococcus sp.]
MNKKMITIIAALAMCTAMAGCSESEPASSSKAETTTTTTAAAESAAPAESTADESAVTNVGTTDYDVDGDFRAFEQLKDKYDGNYLASLTGQMTNNGTKYTICIKDGKAYESSTIQGMKSYYVYPGDGKKYNVSEATTTYSVNGADENDWKDSDILFGAALDFDHAYVDASTNVVHEYYKLDSAVAGAEGQIVYGFDGATYDLKQVVLLPEGADESSAVYFTVDSIGEADDSLLAVPDLSAYTEE